MYNKVPKDILETLKGEPVDFIVQSRYDYGKRSLGWLTIIVVGMFSWIFVFPLMFSFPLIELLTVGTTNITVNDSPQTFTRENPWLPLVFALIPLSFSLIFIVPLGFLLYKGIRYLRKKGPWYAGTNKHLIEFKDQNVNYYKWSDFDHSLQTKKNRDKTLDIILTQNRTHSLPLIQHVKNPHSKKNTSTSAVHITTQRIDLTNLINRSWFFNKIGLLGLHNGHLVLDMIRHNMERFRK